LIASLYRDRKARGKPPSYVEPANFALALSHVLIARANPQAALSGGAQPLTVTALRDALRAPALAGSPVVMALTPILYQAGDDLDAALKGIEAWFGAAMNRVSGWYKVRTQKVLFVIGLLLAALCNVDAIEIYGTLNRSSELRAAVVSAGQQMVASGKVGEVNLAQPSNHPPSSAELASLRPVWEPVATRLPIGYSCLGVALQPDVASGKAVAKADPWQACANELAASWRGRSAAAWMLKLVGWMLTAFAATLGAAYWFQLLAKAINIRGSGTKPVTPTASTQAIETTRPSGRAELA
jgi:hypothetical protein